MMKLHVTLLFYFVVSSQNLWALSEYFNSGISTEGVAMGNAMTADAVGYQSILYNPAGMARGLRKKPEIFSANLDAFMNMNSFSDMTTMKTTGFYNLLAKGARDSNNYKFYKIQTAPSICYRYYCFTLLAGYQVAGTSNGTTFDSYSYFDLIPNLGFAYSFAGNTIKIGATIRSHMRDGLVGEFDAATLAQGELAIKENMQGGIAFDGDIGILFTLPYRMIPTLGITAQNLSESHFSKFHLFGGKSSQTPPKINRTANVAFSIHPIFSKQLRGTFAVELKHLEDVDTHWTKRFHVGFKLEDEKLFYLWAGLNQLYWTAGIGLRSPLGHLEIGSYGAEIGSKTDSKEDRRIFLRYTIQL